MSPTMKKLELQHLAIGMESAVLTNENFFDNMAGRLTSFMSDVKSFLQVRLQNESSLAENVNFVVSYPQLIAKLQDINYTSVKSVTVHCPPGLSVTYLELLDKLEEASLITNALQKDVLTPILKWLAVHLSKPELFASFSGSNSIPDLKQHDLAGIKTKLQLCFKESNTRTAVPYGEAFKRNADWNESITRVRLLQDSINAYPLAQLNDDVAELTKRFDILIAKIENKNELTLSANKVQALSALCFAVAQECEFYAFYSVQLQSTLRALMDTEQVLAKAFNVIK